MELLLEAKVRDRAALVEPVITAETIAQMSGLADDVYVDPAVIGYVAELGEESRRLPHVKLGLSARGLPGLHPGRQDLGRRRRPRPRGARRRHASWPSRCCATGSSWTPRRSSRAPPSRT